VNIVFGARAIAMSDRINQIKKRSNNLNLQIEQLDFINSFKMLHV
jgi:hypothetical protein